METTTLSASRRTNFDLIRILSCLLVMIIHFNASVSGYDYSGQFLYPNGIVPNNLLGIYLGEYGNTLFFMLSGACLMCSKRSIDRRSGVKDILNFYWKRAKTIFPVFWIAWLGATCLGFLRYKCLPAGSPLHLLTSLCGMDGYSMARSWFPASFYQVGEWFLGCILLCYLLWPFIRMIWVRLPKVVFLIASACAYVLIVRLTDGNTLLVSVRLGQMLAGAFFTEYVKKAKDWKLIGISILCTALCFVFRQYIHETTVCLSLCWTIFVLISAWVEAAPGLFGALAPSLSKAAALSFPMILVHHKLISILASYFDLQVFPYRNTVVMFVTFLFLTVVLAKWLDKGTKKATAAVTAVFAYLKRKLSRKETVSAQ